MGDPERIGPFSIRRAIGEGGMGTVYEAVDEAGHPLAIKVLHPELTRREDARSRFLGEVRILEQLVHPNVVRSFASGDFDGKLVLVLELLEGRTLRDELSAIGRMPARRAAEIATAVASALVAAHEREPPVIHRDLKPENIMIGPAGAVKVMDFGIAKVLDDLQPRTRTTQIVGTAQYMSPEHADGRGVTSRSDLYSLGLLLYEMIAGAPPFGGGSILALLRAHAERPPPPFDDAIRRELPPALEALVQQLLAKRPEDRPPSARAVHDALAPLAGVTALPPPAIAPPPASVEGMPATVPAPPVASPAHLQAVARRADLPPPEPLAEPPMQAAAPGPYAGYPAITPHVPPAPTPAVAATAPRADTIDIIAALEKKKSPPKRPGLWIALGSVVLLGALVGVAMLVLPWRKLLGLESSSRSRDKSAAGASTPAGKPGGDRFLAWTVPAKWTEYRASDLLTVAAYDVPRDPSETTRINITVRAPSKGPAEAIQASFKSRFSSCAGCDAIARRKVGNLDVATYEMRGNYVSVGKDDVRANAVGLGAAVHVGETFYDIRLIGPDRSVNAARADFEAFIQSMRPATP